MRLWRESRHAIGWVCEAAHAWMLRLHVRAAERVQGGKTATCLLSSGGFLIGFKSPILIPIIYDKRGFISCNSEI